MQYIIGCLMIILTYSSFMALTTSEKQKIAPVNAPALQETFKTKENPPPSEYRETPTNPIMQEIADVFGEEYRLAIAVAMAESELNPNAMNVNTDGSRDIGIFQINERHGWSEEELLDWKTNISIAKDLRDREGWSSWTAYNNGTYRKYL